MWSKFIENFNGKSLILPKSWVSSDHLTLYTDASGAVDFAAILKEKWLHKGGQRINNHNR